MQGMLGNSVPGWAAINSTRPKEQCIFWWAANSFCHILCDVDDNHTHFIDEETKT